MQQFDYNSYLKKNPLLNELYEVTEASSNYNDLLDQLVTMVSSGELDKEAIDDINYTLMSARHKFTASKRSPDSRLAASAKGKTTKLLSKISDKLANKLGIQFGFRNPDGTDVDNDAAPNMFALNIGMHRDKKLQKKWNAAFNAAFIQAAAEQGITDQEVIRKHIDFKD